MDVITFPENLSSTSGLPILLHGVISLPDATSNDMINVLLVSRVLVKSKARSPVFSSAVNIDEPSGIRCILQWLDDITAQTTFESSFDPSV